MRCARCVFFFVPLRTEVYAVNLLYEIFAVLYARGALYHIFHGTTKKNYIYYQYVETITNKKCIYIKKQILQLNTNKHVFVFY